MANDKSVMAVIRAARPIFKNNHDKIAFVAHASFLANGYALTATGPAAFSETAALSAPSTKEVGLENWNEVDGEYAFVYGNTEKNREKVFVKCLVLNGKLAVSAFADGAPEPVNMEINVADYVVENGGSNYSEQFKNLDKLVRKLDEEILSKLNGPSPSSSTLKLGGSSSSSNVHPSLERNQRSRQETEPGVGFYEPAGPQFHPSGVVAPPVPTNPISDIYPGPGAGIFPRRGGRDGGMLIGPDHPAWSGLVGPDPSFPSHEAPPNIPPGARFDPYHPPGVPGFEPTRNTRFPRRPPGTHPDIEPFGGNDLDLI